MDISKLSLGYFTPIDKLCDWNIRRISDLKFEENLWQTIKLELSIYIRSCSIYMI